jgi:hypothetical protein
MKIRPVGAEVFHVDRRTDTTKLTVALGNFANTPRMTYNFLQPARYLLPLSFQYCF